MSNQDDSRVNILTRWKETARRLESEIATLAIAYRDPRVPLPAKFLIAGLVAYAISPIDLIPDFIPILGYLDDLLILPLGIALAIRLIPSSVMAEARAKVAETNQPRSQAGAVIVILLWIIAAVLVYRRLRR